MRILVQSFLEMSEKEQREFLMKRILWRVIRTAQAKLERLAKRAAMQ